MPSSLTILSVGCFVAQLFVLSIMIKRKLRSEFPGFFALVASNTFATIALPITLRWFRMDYAYVYWSIAAVSMLLSFWIFYEVFVAILKPYSALIDLGKMLFRWATLFLFIGSLVTAISTRGSQFTKICAVILLLERCAQLMQCGMLLLLMAFESRLNLSWRNHGMCIGLGVGAFCAWDMACTFAGQYLSSSQATLNILNGAVSLGFYAYWAAMFLLPQPHRKNVLDSPSRLIFQRWNEALMATPLVGRRAEVITMSPIESFLPGVERTVERVMARKMMH